MNTDWEKAIDFVLRMEGNGRTYNGEVDNNPGDPGGVTKWGISKKAYPALNIPDLTLEDAKALYKRDYWDACSCDELPGALATAVFDTAVNMGISGAKRLLQITLGVDVDGVIGSKTIAAAHAATPGYVKKYMANRWAEYARRIVANPNLLKFAMDWSYRILRLSDLISGVAND